MAADRWELDRTFPAPGGGGRAALDAPRAGPRGPGSSAPDSGLRRFFEFSRAFPGLPVAAVGTPRSRCGTLSAVPARLGEE
ncbi:hypothetical protein AT728_22640 [Streptomyces silvensis]|uniref:Uncharacterized protein n=1 Tax=Streptomyces silvensis TaxID=1765722 RepID=A0A0W7X1S0_9ACTN|nr:hypothetical protein AT728_22640 [Streptomyces silvensis]